MPKKKQRQRRVRISAPNRYRMQPPTVRGGEQEGTAPCQPERAGQHPTRQPPDRPAADNGDVRTSWVTKVSVPINIIIIADTSPQGQLRGSGLQNARRRHGIEWNQWTLFLHCSFKLRTKAACAIALLTCVGPQSNDL